MAGNQQVLYDMRKPTDVFQEFEAAMQANQPPPSNGHYSGKPKKVKTLAKLQRQARRKNRGK